MLDSLIEERKKKLQRIKERGDNPYPARVERDFPISEAVKNFSGLSESGKKISLAGRIK